MSHRLLHTLVFASTSLLACGGQLGEIIVEPPDEPDASPKKDATAPEDVAVTLDAGTDARTCEAGWPTTKGQICSFDAGIVCCQASWDVDGGTVCCEQEQ